MHKLRHIIRHEYLTIIRQPSFWIAMTAIPVLAAIVITLSVIGNQSSSQHVAEVAKQLHNVAIIDESGLINKNVIKASQLKLEPTSQLDALTTQVRKGTLEALVVYPENLKVGRSYQIYLTSTDFTKLSGVTTLADNLLKTSLFLPLGSPQIIALAQNGATSDVTMFKNGVATGGFNDYIAPGLFVVLFYLIFAFSVSYMLTSVSEEKENRSMEMVLTYVKPRSLIVGKLLAVCLVTLTQVLFFALLAIIAYIVMANTGNNVSLPLGISLDKISFHFWPIFFGATYLVIGFLMFAGFMTTAAAATTSAKEANNYSSVFFIGAFIPFYFITTIVTDPNSSLVHFLTFFPLTSPVITLIRNTVGSMSLTESWLALGVMAVFMLISIWVAIRAFKLGALEFSQTIKLSKLFKRS